MDAQSRPHPLAHTINAAATALGISRRTVYQLLATGALRSVRVGARQRIPTAELARLLEVRSPCAPELIETAATLAEPVTAAPATVERDVEPSAPESGSEPLTPLSELMRRAGV
ncbi:MAG: helix-turn-helix domain-containing protein [Steroidobacteraceae bacterium]